MTKKVKQQEQTKPLLNEDEIKCVLDKFFRENGWEIVGIKYGNNEGVDFEAKNDKLYWKIEVKSEYKRTQANRNSFLEVWGEILTRMDKANTYYGVAFPDIERYRYLCSNITPEAKKRIKVFILFFKIEEHVLQEIDLLSWDENNKIEVPLPFRNFGKNEVSHE